MRTERAEAHEAGEGDDPDVLGMENIATIKLEEPTLDAWMSERNIGLGTD